MTQKLPDVYVFTESEEWDKSQAENCVASVVKQFPIFLERDLSHCVINFILADDLHLQDYNKLYRNQDKPTNVLSFPYIADKGAPEENFEILGDIWFSYETIEREATEQNKPFWDHFSHLVAHGLLHLLGYDHENDKDAEIMEALEVQILSAIDIPNPYEEGAA